MSRRQSRRALAWIAVLVLAVTAAGLLWSPSCRSGLEASGAADQYRREQLVRPLAPGWRWPAPPFAAGDETGYGPDAGTIAADDYWFCSWASRAVSRGLSAAARRAALGHVAEVRGTALFRAYVPSDRAAFGAMVSRAVGGDLAGLRVHVRANCRRS